MATSMAAKRRIEGFMAGVVCEWRFVFRRGKVMRCGVPSQGRSSGSRFARPCNGGLSQVIRSNLVSHGAKGGLVQPPGHTASTCIRYGYNRRGLQRAIHCWSWRMLVPEFRMASVSMGRSADGSLALWRCTKRGRPRLREALQQLSGCLRCTGLSKGCSAGPSWPSQRSNPRCRRRRGTWSP